MEFDCASREMSHKSSTVNPIGPQPPSQRPEGKMLPPIGGQPERLQSGQLKHRERWLCGSAPPISAVGTHLLSAHIPIVALSPSKDWPDRRFPKHDVGSWSQHVALCMILRGRWPPQSCHGVMAPICERSCPVVYGHVNQNDMDEVGECKAYLVRVAAWTTVVPPSL